MKPRWTFEEVVSLALATGLVITVCVLFGTVEEFTAFETLLCCIALPAGLSAVGNTMEDRADRLHP